MNKQEYAERVANRRHAPIPKDFHIPDIGFTHDHIAKRNECYQACLALFDMLEADGPRIVPVEPVMALKRKFQSGNVCEVDRAMVRRIEVQSMLDSAGGCDDTPAER